MRYLSLVDGKTRTIDEHVRILDAIRANDAETASDVLHTHLCHIKTYINDIRTQYPDYFEETSQ